MLYERITLLCKERGISKRKLSIECGMDPSAISKWKAATPNSDNLRKVADYFGVSVDWLTGASDERSAAPFYVKDDAATKSEKMLEKQRMLMESVAKLSEEQMDALIAVATQLKGTNPDG